MSLNNCNFLGRFTRDPEIRYTQSQKPVATFSLAVDRDFKPAEGERGADFVDCVAWNALAEHIGKWFTKGSPAVVSGRLEGRQWVDAEGNKHYKSEIRVENIYFASPKTSGTQTEPQLSDLTPANEGQLPF